jgi:hypothetical protein
MAIDLEYKFGRIGFNDEHTAARSFLWFTTGTDFTQTMFAGVERTIRIYETDEERFQRRLREGYDFDGLELVQSMMLQKMSMRPSLVGKMPPKTECLGPYDANEHILHAAEVDALRARPGVGAPEFPEQLRDASIAVLNNVLLSYLEKHVAPASSTYDTTTSAAASLFPKHENATSTDRCLYGFITRPNSEIIEGYDTVAVRKRIISFLTPQCGDNSLIRDADFVDGLVACVAFLASDVLQLANNWRRDSGISSLVPSHLRGAVMTDNDLLDFFTFSRMFWYGGAS